MLVNEIMSTSLEWVGPDVTLQESARKMRDRNIGCLPVEDGDRIIGMITDRDIACRAVADGRDPATTTVRDVMSVGITYCFDDDDVTKAVQIMEDKHIRRLPVLNHDERLVGLLSLDDLATHCSHEVSGEVMEAVAPH
jgi:CBS domain-containing protein